MNLDFVIIGGQKCGSTYLQEVINEHPEINMVDGECPHFETPDYESGGLNELKKLIDELDNNKVLGIKRPIYLSKNEVPPRIKEFNKDIKLIVIIRDPLERLKSAYFHYMNYGFSPFLPLNVGVEKLLKEELKEEFPRTTEILEFSYYSKFIDSYLNIFKENILVLTYDELKKDKLLIIKRCYSFLGVDENFIPFNILNRQPQKVNYSIPRAKFLSKMNSHQYIYNKNKTRLFVKEKSIWDKLVCSCIYLMDWMFFKWFFKVNKKPKFDKKIEQILKNKYIIDIENLENRLKINLNSWK